MRITLCGSASDEANYHKWNKLLTLAGHCVYSLGAFPSIEGGKDWYNEDEKTKLDLVHLKKISYSDAVFIVGKVGDSTEREILWARVSGKRVYYSDRLTDRDRCDLGFDRDGKGLEWIKKPS